MRRNLQSGFSLVELLITMAMMVTMSAAVFEAMRFVTERRRQEEVKVDVTQETRDFMDQMARDLRNAGYPNPRMYTGCYSGVGCVLGPNPLNTQYVAAGLVAASATDVLFEGDMNQDGVVDSVRYTLQAGPGGTCPCAIRRSQVNKIAAPPNAQPTTYNVEMDNVINSTGVGNAPFPIAGNTPWGTANDVFYATYKIPPVFAYFDINNAPVAVPNDLTGANFGLGQAAAANVRSMEVVLNVLPQYADVHTRLRAGVSVRTTVRFNNTQ